MGRGIPVLGRVAPPPPRDLPMNSFHRAGNTRSTSFSKFSVVVAGRTVFANCCSTKVISLIKRQTIMSEKLEQPSANRAISSFLVPQCPPVNRKRKAIACSDTRHLSSSIPAKVLSVRNNGCLLRVGTKFLKMDPETSTIKPNAQFKLAGQEKWRRGNITYDIDNEGKKILLTVVTKKKVEDYAIHVTPWTMYTPDAGSHTIHISDEVTRIKFSYFDQKDYDVTHSKFHAIITKVIEDEATGKSTLKMLCNSDWEDDSTDSE